MYVIVGRSCEHTTCRHPACPVVHDIYDHHDGTVPPIHCTACHQRAFADVRTDGRELIVRCPHCGNQAEYVKRRGRAVELNTRAGEPAGKE
jgi:NAD-dependent SIR2 family protein deacetylase